MNGALETLGDWPQVIVTSYPEGLPQRFCSHSVAKHARRNQILFMASRKRKRGRDQFQSTLLLCWSVAKRMCSLEALETSELVTQSDAVSFVDSGDVANLVEEEVLPDDEPCDYVSPGSPECALKVTEPAAASRRQGIGQALRPCMSPAEASLAVANLSPGNKYLLVSDPFVPDCSHPFLKVNSYGCNHSF